MALGRQGLSQQRNLGALAAAFDAFKGDKKSGHAKSLQRIWKV
jgi:hypothetical protein